MAPRPLPASPAWNLLLLAAGLVPFAVALLFATGEGEAVLFRGGSWGGPCAFLQATGMPCTTCGMTRSWVNLSEGNILAAFRYNPAGAALYLWLLTLGPLGLSRLASPRARAHGLPWQVLVGWILFWLLGLYLGGWGLRLLGVNPLPGA